MPYYAETGRSHPPNRLTLQITLLWKTEYPPKIGENEANWEGGIMKNELKKKYMLYKLTSRYTAKFLAGHYVWGIQLPLQSQSQISSGFNPKLCRYQILHRTMGSLLHFWQKLQRMSISTSTSQRLCFVLVHTCTVPVQLVGLRAVPFLFRVCSNWYTLDILHRVASVFLVRLGGFFFFARNCRERNLLSICSLLFSATTSAFLTKKEAYVNMGKQRVVVGEEDGNKMTGDHHWGRVVVPHVFRLVSLYLGQRDVCALLCVSASCHRQLAAHAPVCKVCLLA